jgi:coenzyme F420-reducing hydrogenase beta subunit
MSGTAIETVTQIDRVIGGGYCIGCGTCAFADPQHFSMEMNAEGMWRAERQASSDPVFPVERICPMSGDGLSEDQIATRLYPDLPAHSEIGRYEKCLAGHVSEGDFRKDGGSGGLVSWLLVELLRTGEVDAIIHVSTNPHARPDDLLFRYTVSYDAESIQTGAKSRYYPVEMSQLLQLVTASRQRFAIVGVPCFIKAIRLMQMQELLPRDRTPYLIGLVCGHLKSRFFAEYLAWQKGTLPSELTAFNFRHKLPDRPASSYGFSMTYREAATGEDVTEVHPMSETDGKDWGEGLFKNPACEYCDDVLAECADIAIGDAWLPGYVDDPQGTNVVVTRNARLGVLIENGMARGALSFEAISPDEIVESQFSGLRHRREGLAHRLMRRQAAGIWTPKKRVEPMLAPEPSRQKIYDLRQEIAELSNKAFAAAKATGELAAFRKAITPVLRRYRQAQQRPFRQRAIRKIKGLTKRALRLFVPRRALR